MYPHQYNPANDNLDISGGVNEYTDSTIGERATYDENGNVLTYTDSFGKTTVNTYDSQNHLVKSVSGNEITRFVYNGGDNLLQVIYPDQYNPDDDNLNLSAESPVDTYANSTVGDRYTYDADGRVLTYTNRYGCVTTNTYDSEGNLTSTARSDGTLYTFDKDGKIEKETFANGLVRNFAYTSNQTVVTGSNGVTATYNMNAFGEVSEYKLQNGESNKSYSYTYDSDGNITSISLNGSLRQSFTYNSSNELVRVDDKASNKSVTYAYDFVGNITSVKTYLYTTGTLGSPLTTQNYTYNSQNQRTDLGYDASGNLTSLNGYTFTWSGRRLTAAVNANTNISYTYNHNCIRTSKTVNGTTTYYEVDENNNVVKQYELVNDAETNVIEFVYDSSNSPIYFTYNNATYYYEKNLQGDIVAILDGSGNTVVEYTYDIWGKLVSITGTLADTVGTINPLRYRGYYYDTETQLYYLQSRYYSPDLMRFISQDDPVFSNAQGEPLGSNLYVYCLNNPTNHSDPTGEWYYSLNDFYYQNFIKKRINNKYGYTASMYKCYYAQYYYNVKKLGYYTDYIYDQYYKKVAYLRFAAAIVKNVGCETIAVYNIMKMIGRYQYYPDILNECYMNGLAVHNGYLGIRPTNLRKYFNAHYVRYNYYTDKRQFFAKIGRSRFGIISYWNNLPIISSLHTIAYKRIGNKFYFYNADSRYNTIDKIKGRYFICGYIF